MFKARYVVEEKLWLLQKPGSLDKSVTKTKPKTDNDFSGICCPLCKWKPKRSSRWQCSDCQAPEYFFASCVVAWFGIPSEQRASVQVVTTSGNLPPARRASSGQNTTIGMSEKYSTNFCQR
jgi:hypothetical protein